MNYLPPRFTPYSFFWPRFFVFCFDMEFLKGDGLRVFASNDYLGIAGHPEMRWVAAETAKMYGMGARASPLMSGYSPFHAKLEAKLAHLTKRESALLFPTGSNDCVEGALIGI